MAVVGVVVCSLMISLPHANGAFSKPGHRTYVLVTLIPADVQLKTFGMSNFFRKWDKAIGLTGVSSSSSWVCTWKSMDRSFQKHFSFCLSLATILGNKMP